LTTECIALFTHLNFRPTPDKWAEEFKRRRKRWQCGNCSEYLIEDGIMAKVDMLLGRVDASVEVEILSYAA